MRYLQVYYSMMDEGKEGRWYLPIQRRRLCLGLTLLFLLLLVIIAAPVVARICSRQTIEPLASIGELVDHSFCSLLRPVEVSFVPLLMMF